MKKKVISLRAHKLTVEVLGKPMLLPLPKGCLGVAWIFESKKSARDFLGKDADNLIEVEIPKGEK